MLSRHPEPVNTNPAAINTVLFDLDGTLADTAPDLVDALNRVLAEQGRDPQPLAFIRPIVSQGGRAMVRRAFGIEHDDPAFEALLQRFLDVYGENVAVHTRLFPGMETVLDALEDGGLSWGIVTNKSGWLAEPLVHALKLADRAACVVSGDTTASRKPHPEPLLHACRQTDRQPGQCLYVGDAANDIEAGREAGMRTMVALFGYIPAGEDPQSWGADALINRPDEIIDWLDMHK
jgi:N-acetyl-D-muramate 6-phosphate phosphatase